MKQSIRKCLLCTLLLLTVLVACFQSEPARAADEVKLISQNTYDAVYQNTGTNYPVAQTFTLSQSATITKLKVGLYAPFGPTTIKASIISGAPEDRGSELKYATAYVTATALTMVDFKFSTPVQLSSGVYSIYLYQMGNYAFMYGTSSMNPYNEGSLYEYGGQSWDHYESEDLQFEIWGEWMPGEPPHKQRMTATA